MEGAAFFYDTACEMYFPPYGGHGTVGGREDGVTASALLTQACAIWFFALRRTLAL